MREALASLPGVVEVKTDVEKQVATCRIDSEQFDSEKAIALLDETGFPDGAVLETKSDSDAEGAKEEAPKPESTEES